MVNNILFLNLAVKAAKEAGEFLKTGFYSNQVVVGKGRHDVVSKVDLESEKSILDLITNNFPNHSIHAEESGTLEKNSDYKWYIDPLDGTSNLLLGIPYFSVSIALSYKSEVIIGVVYNPIVDELYTAEKGKGSFMNGENIRVSSQENLSNALIASAYSSDEKDIKRGLKTIEGLALHSRKVVINFSPALDLCNIARGKLDALVDNGTTPEDHAAGSLILAEAGGKIENYNKTGWNVENVGIIASNSLIHHFLREYTF